MKRIIDGRKYDTDAPNTVEVANFSTCLGRSNFRHYCESLYRTGGGFWFLAGEGGPMTHYAQRCGDMWGSGERIIPLSPAEAREWLERNGETSAIEQHFGGEIVDTDMPPSAAPQA